MASIDLTVKTREALGKSAVRKLRNTGLVPGIIYGKAGKNIPISLNPSLLKKVLMKGGANALINLIEEDTKSFGKKTVLVKEIQKDPVESSYLHADFYELDLKKTIEVKVAFSFVGKAEGLTQGGIVQPIVREVEVKCLPHAIPNHIEVDVTPLKVGDSLHLSDIKSMIQGREYELIFANDDTVVTVTIPKEEVVQPTPTAEAAPEVAKAGEAQPSEGEAAKATETPNKEEKKKEEGKK